MARENAKPDGDDPTTPPSGGAPSGGAPGKRSRNESVDFRGERRGNATHRSTTDPDARLARKGNTVGAFLCHSVHALTENRHGLVLAIAVDEANGTAERTCALEMVDRVRQQHHVRVATLGADMGYDSGDFLVELQRRKIIGACRDSFRHDCCNGCCWSRAICSTRTTAAQGLWHKSTTKKDCRRVLRVGQDDLDHAKIQTHRAIQDQAASSTDCRDLQPRANVQAARCVTAPRSGENCMWRGFSRSAVGTEVTQHEPIQSESREAKSTPGKMSAELGFFSVLLEVALQLGTGHGGIGHGSPAMGAWNSF